MTSLYDTDYVAWLEETAKLLDARDFDHVDLEHLIEEVACYRHGHEEALEGTDVPEEAMPTQSPWSLEALLTEGWLPDAHVSAGQ